MMKAYVCLSVLIAFLITVPLIVIPAYIGFSIPDRRIILEGERDAELEENTFYIILNAYYLFFILGNVLPFTFLVVRSTFARMNLKNHRKNGKSGDISTEPNIFGDGKYPRISIIIPCYNESRNVGQAISNCFNQTYRGEIEVIVIDDGSRDSTWSISRIFKGKSDRNMVKIFHKENGGKASALTFGANHASGPIILMTDGDSRMDKNAVAEIVETFRTYPDAGIVGGFVTIRNTFTGYLTKLQQLEYVITQHVVRISQSDDGSVLIAPGPIFGMRTDLARMFPPLDRTVVEDCDLTMSVLSTGYTTRAAVKARSYTEAPASWKGWLNQRRRWIYGQFQAWRENRWHLKHNPWGLYTYFTWLSTTLSAVIFMISMAVTGIFLIGGGSFYSFMEFIALRTIMLMIFYFGIRMFIILQYGETRKLIHYLPLKTFYDIINGFHTAYLYFMYISGLGIKLKWGHRRVVIH
ncbi:MAG: glycosyltransferase [Thermoplasmatota archaeon]